MKIATVLSFVAPALAVSIDRLEKRASPLEVTIESVGNSAVKASITNTGASALKVFKSASILDNAAVEKTQVFSGGECFSCPAPNSVPLDSSTNSILPLSPDAKPHQANNTNSQPTKWRLTASVFNFRPPI